jgi:hypothetical protein
MSRDSFDEQWTQKRFINDEDQMLLVSVSNDYNGVVLNLNGNEFWIPKENAKDVAEAILSMASGLE